MIKTTILPRAAVLASVAATLMLAMSQAGADAKLETTTPKADSTVSSPPMVQVHFNEAVETKLSSLKSIASDGGDIPIMNMNDAKDPATLSIMPNMPLKPGVYTAAWTIASVGGRKDTGSFKFTVK
jgi:hypothetical protein